MRTIIFCLAIIQSLAVARPAHARPAGRVPTRPGAQPAWATYQQPPAS